MVALVLSSALGCEMTLTKGGLDMWWLEATHPLGSDHPQVQTMFCQCHFTAQSIASTKAPLFRSQGGGARKEGLVSIVCACVKISWNSMKSYSSVIRSGYWRRKRHSGPGLRQTRLQLVCPFRGPFLMLGRTPWTSWSYMYLVYHLRRNSDQQSRQYSRQKVPHRGVERHKQSL